MTDRRHYQQVMLVDVLRLYRAIVETTDTLRPDDRAQLLALMPLMDGRDVAGFGQACREYYRDKDRSDRTPRAVLYMHIGVLCGHAGAA